jgi:hypothetical protein
MSMFDVRPNAPSPWLYVEPPPADEPPGFRVAPDGQSGSPPFSSASFNSSVGTAPSTSTSFEDAIRLATGLYGPADLATLQRNPIQEALDEIKRIYAGVAAGSPSLFGHQGPSNGVVTPVSGLPLSPYASESSLLPATEPSAPLSPVRHVEGNYFATGGTPFSSPSRDLTQSDPGLAPSPVPESLRAPDAREVTCHGYRPI